MGLPFTPTGLLTEEDLKAWTAYARTGDLEKWLKENQIPYFRGKGNKVITTLGLIEKRAGASDLQRDSEVEFQ